MLDTFLNPMAFSVLPYPYFSLVSHNNQSVLVNNKSVHVRVHVCMCVVDAVLLSLLSLALCTCLQSWPLAGIWGLGFVIVPMLILSTQVIVLCYTRLPRLIL